MARKSRTCAFCGNPIPAKGRRKYCRGGCKDKAYRERKRLEQEGATIATARKSSQSSRPRRVRTRRVRRRVYLDVFTDNGQRIGLLLKVTRGRVKVRHLGTEDEIDWLPWEKVRGYYDPRDPDTAATGKIKVLDPQEREAFLEGFL